MSKETFGILFVVLCVIFVLTSCSADDPAPVASIMVEEDVKEEPKPEPKQVPKEEEFVPYKEKVCITINGKEKCRTITKHKKHEGTKIKK